MTDLNRTTVRIPTPSGFDIEAWFYRPEGQGPFPAVVMGHGLGAVKVGGLASFAERFCVNCWDRAGTAAPRTSSLNTGRMGSPCSGNLPRRPWESNSACRIRPIRH